MIKKFYALKRRLEEITKNIYIIKKKNIKIYRSDVINESIKKILEELDKLDEMI